MEWYMGQNNGTMFYYFSNGIEPAIYVSNTNLIPKHNLKKLCTSAVY